MKRAVAGCLVWFVVSVPLAALLESRMWTHALVQLPALAVAGFLLAPRSRAAEPSLFAGSALLVALFASAIWMLPRMLDASLQGSGAQLLKTVTIPLLVGLPLGWSWRQLSDLTRAFIWANLVSMLVALGWLYLAAPIRVCNYYRIDEQADLGVAYLALAAAVIVAWLPRVFLAPGSTAGSGARDSPTTRELPLQRHHTQ